MGNLVSIEFDCGENDDQDQVKKKVNQQKITDILAEDPLLEDMCEKAGIEADGGKYQCLKKTSDFS